jgi:hypothetical protein
MKIDTRLHHVDAVIEQRVLWGEDKDISKYVDTRLHHVDAVIEQRVLWGGGDDRDLGA